MGQSTPTTTMALDTFESRYAAFRSELPPSEQERFDELVAKARRHSNAINRRPHLDFERPVLLSMLLEGMRELDEMREELRGMGDQMEVLLHALAEAGLVVRRLPARTSLELGRLGQTRLAGSGSTRPPENEMEEARILHAHASPPRSDTLKYT